MSRENDGPFGGKEMFIFDGQKLAEHDAGIRLEAKRDTLREVVRRLSRASSLVDVHEELLAQIRMMEKK
jgi:hypothetical protein